MKQLITFILSLVFLSSCSTNTSQNENKSTPNLELESSEKVDSVKTPINDDQSLNTTEVNTNSDEILPNGTYIFDVAYAEWQGQSMDEKVKVLIKGNSITIFYEGGGEMISLEKGALMTQGKIMKHKSGEWIIGKKESDKDSDEVGGCTDGPEIIDFKNKTYWIC